MLEIGAGRSHDTRFEIHALGSGKSLKGPARFKPGLKRSAGPGLRSTGENEEDVRLTPADPHWRRLRRASEFEEGYDTSHLTSSFCLFPSAFSPSYLPRAFDEILVAGEFLQTHRATRVKPVGADPDFSPKTEFATIVEPG